MAYGARLESVLGASPRGFESPILRHRTPGPLQVPGFLLPVASRVVGAVWPDLMGRPAVCAGGRRPAHGCRRLAVQDRQYGCLIPPLPLFVRACVGLEPRSPLRTRNGRFWCSYRVHRCRWFQWLLFIGEHWCCRFQSRHVASPRARCFPPCSA